VTSLVFADFAGLLTLGEETGLASSARFQALRADLDKIQAIGLTSTRTPGESSAQPTVRIPWSAESSGVCTECGYRSLAAGVRGSPRSSCSARSTVRTIIRGWETPRNENSNSASAAVSKSTVPM
jgi:hypothetical protein